MEIKIVIFRLNTYSLIVKIYLIFIYKIIYFI